LPLDQNHLSLIMDLVANDEMNVEAATKAIARLAEHARVIDSSDEARFRDLYREDMGGYRIDNYHRPWSQEDIQLLLKMRRAGTDFSKIARRLKRTERGVRSRWAFELMLEREANRNTSLPAATEVIEKCFEELVDERPAGFASWYVPARENHPSKVESSTSTSQDERKEMLD